MESKDYLRRKLVQRFETRPMREEEALGVVDLIYRTYGYTYQGRARGVYDPAELVRLNRRGRLTSIVTVLPSNTVVAHIALRKGREEGEFEIAEAVVDEKHRGGEIANSIVQGCLDLAAEHKARKIISDVVTFHPAAQHVLHGFGFRPTALIVGVHPENLAFRGINSEHVPQRESFVHVQLHLAREGKSVRLPGHHAEMIGEIYESLELERTSLPGPGGALPRQSEFDVSLEARWLAGTVDVTLVGRDVVSQIERILDDFRKGFLRHVRVTLPLDDPHAADVVGDLEALGLFFSGIDPDHGGRDRLILTAIEGIGVRPESIRLYGKAARRLGDYVFARCPAVAAAAEPGDASAGATAAGGPQALSSADAETRARLRFAKCLAAGLAHEVNNPLNIVTGSVYYLKHALRGHDDEKVDRYLRSIEEEVARVAKLIDNLQKFSSPEEIAKQPLDLNAVVEQGLALVERYMKSRGVTVERRLAAGPVTVIGNPSQLQQVLVHLLLNAFETSRDGSRIEVETKPGKGEVELAVRDTGRGIPPDVLPMIFEPFFTTKEVGAGLGLGLSISQGIVEAHGGRIEVETEAGRGSRFRIVLLAAPAEAERILRATARERSYERSA